MNPQPLPPAPSAPAPQLIGGASGPPQRAVAAAAPGAAPHPSPAPMQLPPAANPIARAAVVAAPHPPPGPPPAPVQSAPAPNAAAGGADEDEVVHCRIRGKWYAAGSSTAVLTVMRARGVVFRIDSALLCGSCVALTLTLLNTPATAPEAQEYDWCLRLIVLLTIKYTFAIVICFAQVVVPVVRSRNFPCHAALYAADCGVSVFLILLMGLSTRNGGRQQPSRDAPCACACMSAQTVCFQIAWLCVTCARVVMVLFVAMYRRARAHGDEREAAELAAQIAAHDLPPRRSAAMQLREQLRGLTAAELALLRTFTYESARKPEVVDPRSPHVSRPTVIAIPPSPLPQPLAPNSAAAAAVTGVQLPPVTVSRDGTATQSDGDPKPLLQPLPAEAKRDRAQPHALPRPNQSQPQPQPKPQAQAQAQSQSQQQQSVSAGVGAEADAADEGECCAICLDPLRDGDTVMRLQRCTHLFHAPCIREWLATRNQCPYCRAFAVYRNPN